MDMRLALAAGLALTAFGSQLAAAGDLERKCAKEEIKEQRDEDRDRKHLAPDNKWDELCVPPPPPPPIEPPVFVLPPDSPVPLPPPPPPMEL